MKITKRQLRRIIKEELQKEAKTRGLHRGLEQSYLKNIGFEIKKALGLGIHRDDIAEYIESFMMKIGEEQ